MPLHYTPAGEPYIRLPAPLSHIILTPPRGLTVDKPGNVEKEKEEETKEEEEEEAIPPESDINACFIALNDPRVHIYLESPPYPYEREHAVAWWKTSYADTQKMLKRQKQQVEESKADGKQIWFDGCPFRDIRDTTLPSSDQLRGDSKEEEEIEKASKIGDFMVLHYPFYELPLDSEERKAAHERNAALPAGHEDLIWCIGFWLMSDHHGKGIMSGVLKSVIHDWAVPKMNVRIMKASAYAGNDASIRVFKKCGFVLEQTVKDATRELAEGKGGGKRDIVVMKWERT